MSKFWLGVPVLLIKRVEAEPGIATETELPASKTKNPPKYVRGNTNTGTPNSAPYSLRLTHYEMRPP